jgi:hypothetical protein
LALAGNKKWIIAYDERVCVQVGDGRRVVIGRLHLDI